MRESHIQNLKSVLDRLQSCRDDQFLSADRFTLLAITYEEKVAVCAAINWAIQKQLEHPKLCQVIAKLDEVRAIITQENPQ